MPLRNNAVNNDNVLLNSCSSIFRQICQTCWANEPEIAPYKPKSNVNLISHLSDSISHLAEFRAHSLYILFFCSVLSNSGTFIRLKFIWIMKIKIFGSQICLGESSASALWIFSLPLLLLCIQNFSLFAPCKLCDICWSMFGRDVTGNKEKRKTSCRESGVNKFHPVTRKSFHACTLFWDGTNVYSLSWSQF